MHLWSVIVPENVGAKGRDRLPMLWSAQVKALIVSGPYTNVLGRQQCEIVVDYKLNHHSLDVPLRRR